MTSSRHCDTHGADTAPSHRFRKAAARALSVAALFLGLSLGSTEAQAQAWNLTMSQRQAYLNYYAPVILKAPPGVWMREIDPISAMQSMTYYLDGRDGAPPVRELEPVPTRTCQAAGGG